MLHRRWLKYWINEMIPVISAIKMWSVLDTQHTFVMVIGFENQASYDDDLFFFLQKKKNFEGLSV